MAFRVALAGLGIARALHTYTHNTIVFVPLSLSHFLSYHFACTHTILRTRTCLNKTSKMKNSPANLRSFLLIGDDEYSDEQHHHHHQAPNGPPSASPENVRHAHAFPGYPGTYPPPPSSGGASMAPTLGPHPSSSSSHPIAARAHSHSHSKGTDDMDEAERTSLFGDIPEAKKRKFILVDDPGKGGRVRVRVTLDTVDIKEIPDSFRKSNSVYPRSWFPLQMQSPPPSASGRRFFEEGDEDDVSVGDRVEVDGGRSRGGSGRGKGKMMVEVPLADGGHVELGVPRMRKSVRSKEVKLNDLGYRMTWHQSRVFADKTVFLQKAREFSCLISLSLPLLEFSSLE